MKQPLIKTTILLPNPSKNVEIPHNDGLMLCVASTSTGRRALVPCYFSVIEKKLYYIGAIHKPRGHIFGHL